MFLCCSWQFVKNAPWCLETQMYQYVCVPVCPGGCAGLCPIPVSYLPELCTGTRESECGAQESAEKPRLFKGVPLISEVEH